MTSRPRHPQAYGQVERSNQTLMRWIHRRLITEKENEINYCWTKYLEDVKYTYNISVHGGKKLSPFMMFLKSPGFNTIMIHDSPANTPDIDSNYESTSRSQEAYIIPSNKILMGDITKKPLHQFFLKMTI
ncbi:hypothetical protein CDIK_3933 [Cucumispora dikerogammari]|nr:hypothetical protein CDIK_3933 [Cucumispora dikerogammari]